MASTKTYNLLNQLSETVQQRAELESQIKALKEQEAELTTEITQQSDFDPIQIRKVIEEEHLGLTLRESYETPYVEWQLIENSDKFSISELEQLAYKAQPKAISLLADKEIMSITHTLQDEVILKVQGKNPDGLPGLVESIPHAFEVRPSGKEYQRMFYDALTPRFAFAKRK